MDPRPVAPPLRPGRSARSPWEIAVAGSISADDITTPAGRAREVLGGSVTYFALAAHWFAPVRLASVVGTDLQERVMGLFDGLRVNLDGVEASAQPTYRWTAVHDPAQGRTLSEHSELGAMTEFSGRLPPPARRAPVLFLGSMEPRLQLAVREQMEAPLLIAADTMNKYIAEQRAGVLAVFARADVIFVNESEASHLARVEDPDLAARRLVTRLAPRALVLKRGARGAVLFQADARLARPAVEVDRVVDPTGAGDAFAGGFLGELARRRAQDPGSLEAALTTALVTASFAIEAFGVDALRAANPERFAQRGDAHAQHARAASRA